MLYVFSTNLAKVKKAWPARILYNDFYCGTEGVGFTKWSRVESVPTYYRGIGPATTDEFDSLKFDFIDVTFQNWKWKWRESICLDKIIWRHYDMKSCKTYIRSTIKINDLIKLHLKMTYSSSINIDGQSSMWMWLMHTHAPRPITMCSKKKCMHGLK